MKPIVKFTLQRVRLDRGGYDRSGAYWGAGSPLFWYFADSDHDDHIRALSRFSAKVKIRDKYPHLDVRFYR
jgi:hypothetical protein